MAESIRSGPVAVLVAAALSLSATLGPAAAVVGPSVDAAALAPYVVMVLSRAGPIAGFCSGVVIARDIVLTAAHCLPPKAAVRIHFRDPNGEPVLLPVAAIEVHPGYRADAIRSRRRSIDLALVRLATPLPERFRPATLSEAASSVVPGMRFRISGFGVTRESDGASSGRLRLATVEVREPLSSVLLWARDPARRGTGACTGDSGGPVLEADRDVVAALILWSAGDGTAQCGALTQALWLAPQRAWISGVVGRWGGPS